MNTKRLGELTAADLMSPSPVTISAYDRVTTAIRLMDDYSVSALPVVDESNRAVGILSLFDLLATTREIQTDISALHQVSEATRDFLIQMLVQQGENTLVNDVMTQPVVTLHKSENLILAARRMEQGRFRHLPVVDDDQHPIGMVSSFDFVRALADLGALAAG